MYAINDLLDLVVAEHAEQLRLSVGAPPIIVLRGEHHVVEGPPISFENADYLLRSIADSRQRRRFRQRGAARFVYTSAKSLQFLVHAKIEDDRVQLLLYPYSHAS